MLAFFIIFIHRTKQGGKIINAAEKLEKIVGIIDFDPKLPILVEELDVPEMNIFLYREDDIPKAYYLSHLLEQREVNLFPEETAVYYSAYVVRLRAQFEFPDIEFFPSVSVEHIGRLRECMLEMLGEDDHNDEFIDCQIFSQVSCVLWEKNKEQSFSIIKSLVFKDARYSAQAFNKI